MDIAKKQDPARWRAVARRQNDVARRRDALADAVDRLRAVLEVSRALTSLDGEDELLDLIVSSACRCLGYRTCVIAVRDERDVLRYRATAGCSPDDDRRLRTLSMSSDAFAILRDAATPFGSVLYVPPGHSVRAHPALAACFIPTEVSAPSSEWRTGSLLFVPLVDRDGAVMGFLNPDDPVDGKLPTRGRITVLEAFAHQAVTALQIVRGRAAERERARAAERERARAAEAQRRQLEGLLHASASVRGSLQLDEVLQQIAAAMADAGGFAGAVIYLRDAEDNVHARASVGLDPDEDARLRATPVPLDMFRHIMRPEMRLSRSYLFDHRYHSSPQELDDALSVPALPPDWSEGQWHPEDSLTVPLEDRDGHCIGLISVDQPYDRAFPDLARIQALELFADHCVVAVEQARLYEEMQALAMTDALTGLPNRTLLHDRLRHALAAAQRERTPLALLLMDLDRFKEVNDTLGHHYGDILLRQVGDRVRTALRASDTIARLGGDEFAMILPATDADGAATVSGSILSALEPPVIVDGHALDIRASIGVAVFPRHGDDAPALLRRADVAMYMAKRARTGVAVYHEEQDQHSAQRLALMTSLRQSLNEDRLRLHYQPLVDVAGERVTAVEALLRWPHPDPAQGFVPSDQFIPLAEHTDIIMPLTYWVLETAIRQCQVWQRAGFRLRVSVNLSAHVLHDTHLPDIVQRLLRRYDTAPEWITLEITESALMVDPTQALEVLGRLDCIGVRMAIDDFGTGYSSLGYLKRLPVHEVKIDRSFVLNLDATTNLKDKAIVRSVIAMAQALGLRVVAEGVERRAIWDALRVLGCDLAQGYYMSRPLPPSELEQWLRTSPWAADQLTTVEA